MIDAVLKIITEAVRSKLTGSITLHMFQGSISTVEKKESIKLA